jgi:hypothetical protein
LKATSFETPIVHLKQIVVVANPKISYSGRRWFGGRLIRNMQVCAENQKDNFFSGGEKTCYVPV